MNEPYKHDYEDYQEQPQNVTKPENVDCGPNFHPTLPALQSSVQVDMQVSSNLFKGPLIIKIQIALKHQM